MTFKETWPALYPELLDAIENMENHFRDVCDFVFIVERGTLWIPQVRPAKRTALASVRFALSFFAEGKIALTESLARISAADVHVFTIPIIANELNYEQIGAGIPASPGAATGRITLSEDAGLSFAAKKCAYIVVRHEVSPEDLGYLWSSEAVITITGGMTSHAAAICRGWQKPCVVGVSDWRIDYGSKCISVGGGRCIREGEWITINASTGRIAKGRAILESIHWSERPELQMLNRMQSFALRLNIVQPQSCGDFWRIRDYFVHSMPLIDQPSHKEAVHRESTRKEVEKESNVAQILCRKLQVVPANQVQNITEVVWGLHRTLSRMLSNALGVGRHDQYCCVLWDPMEFLTRKDDESYVQSIGIEYFNINRHLPYLPDIAHVLLVMQIRYIGEACFLEYTNPRAASLVATTLPVVKALVQINGHTVTLEDLPGVYNVTRRREYSFTWYEDNGIQHRDLVWHVREASAGRRVSQSMSRVAQSIGLMNGSTVTATGKSLIGSHEWRYGHENDGNHTC